MRIVRVRVVHRATAAKATKTLFDVLVRVLYWVWANVRYILRVEGLDADGCKFRNWLGDNTWLGHGIAYSVYLM
jgi:hypothetical protein